jgi:ribosomal protein L20A (L18A)
MKLFLLVFDTKNFYLVVDKSEKEAIKKVKKELSSGYGKIWKLVEIKTANKIVENDINSKYVKTIKAKRWYIK